MPERKPVNTEPSFTFNFGETEGRAYELKGMDFSGRDGGRKARTGALAYLNNSLFLYGDSQPIKLLKVNMKGDLRQSALFGGAEEQ